MKKKSNDKLMEKFLEICRAYVGEMNRKFDYKKTGISARAVNFGFTVCMDYSAVRHWYTKDDAKAALEIFKKYTDQAKQVLVEIKEEHPEIDWKIGKTDVSSALIGKSLNVYNNDINLDLDGIFPEFSYGIGGLKENMTETNKKMTFAELKSRLVDEAADKPFRAQELKKYGFTHDKADDFSDDGTRFFVYRLSGSGMGVSYARDGDTIYLNASPRGGDAYKAELQLSYDEYSKLPGFDKLRMFNGVADTSITPEGIRELIDAMKNYERALLAAVDDAAETDSADAESFNGKVREIFKSAYDDCKKQLVNSLELIAKSTYSKSFDFNIKGLFRDLSNMVSFDSQLVKPGSKDSRDRQRLANPDKALDYARKTASFYADDFSEKLAKLKNEASQSIASESQKITLTIGQLRRLVAESR